MYFNCRWLLRLIVLAACMVPLAGCPPIWEYHAISDPVGAEIYRFQGPMDNATEQLGNTPWDLSSPVPVDMHYTCRKDGYKIASSQDMTVTHNAGTLDHYCINIRMYRLEANDHIERMEQAGEALKRSSEVVEKMLWELRKSLKPVDVAVRVITTRAPVRIAPDPDAQVLGTFNLFDTVHVIGAQLWGWVYVAKNGKDFGWMDSRQFDTSLRDLPQVCGDKAACGKLKAELSSSLAELDKYKRLDMFFIKMAVMKHLSDPSAEVGREREVRAALSKKQLPGEPREFLKGEELRPDPLGTTAKRPVPSEWYTYYCPSGITYHAAIPATSSKECNMAFKIYSQAYGCGREKAMEKAKADLERCE